MVQVESIFKIIFWAVDEEAVKILQDYRHVNNLSFGIYHPHTKYQYNKQQGVGSNGYYQMMRDRPSIFFKIVT